MVYSGYRSNDGESRKGCRMTRETFTVARGAKIGAENLSRMTGRTFDRWNFLTRGRGWAVVDGYFMVAGVGAWKAIG
jgi:hypothetical protein